MPVRMTFMKPKIFSDLPTRIHEILKQSPAGLPQAHVRFYILGRIVYWPGLVAHGGFVMMFWFLDLGPLAAFNFERQQKMKTEGV